ncbi:MAG: PHP-associated domain-containing protein [Bacillota bacterium]
MIIDTHIHENRYSGDSKVSLETVIFQAQKIGLDGICITNHENQKVKNLANKLNQKTDLLILVGAEILTYEGDILVFGINKLPDKKMHADELINYVNKRGGITISAHPFRNNNRGAGSKINNLPGLTAVEVLNGSTSYKNNLKAYNLAKKLNLPTLGASDAHHSQRIGKYASYFEDNITNMQDFIKAIKKNRVSPAIHYNKNYKIINSLKNNKKYFNKRSIAN